MTSRTPPARQSAGELTVLRRWLASPIAQRATRDRPALRRAADRAGLQSGSAAAVASGRCAGAGCGRVVVGSAADGHPALAAGSGRPIHAHRWTIGGLRPGRSSGRLSASAGVGMGALSSACAAEQMNPAGQEGNLRRSSATAAGDTPRPISSTQHSQAPNAPASELDLHSS